VADPNSLTRLARAQRFVAHLGHRDVDQSIALLAPNVIYRAIGTHSFSGLFTGRDEVAAHLRELAERTQGTMDALKWEDWMVGENHVAAFGTVRAEITGRRLTVQLLVLLRFDVNDMIAELHIFYEDERAVARFFDPIAR